MKKMNIALAAISLKCSFYCAGAYSAPIPPMFLLPHKKREGKLFGYYRFLSVM
jgi:hypothetical protein